jgi:hypothetical protein
VKSTRAECLDHLFAFNETGNPAASLSVPWDEKGGNSDAGRESLSHGGDRPADLTDEQRITPGR